MEFYFVRHGKSEFNEKGLLAGHEDIDLVDLGVQEAKNVGQQLASIKFDAVYSSDLQRAKRTAEIILAENHHKTSIQVVKELREIDYGKLAGITSTEVRAKYPEFKKSKAFVHPQGESYEMLSRRVDKFLKDIERTQKTVLIVTHAGVLRYIISKYTDEPHDEHLDKPIPNAKALHVIEENHEVKKVDWVK
jgi:alpha-ribazole phosphatase